jgi:trimeric autotransporter adhesin
MLLLSDASNAGAYLSLRRDETMIKLRAIAMAALLAGLAGRASAQTLTLSTSPASPITYGTPVTLVVILKGVDSTCESGTVQFTSHFGLIGSVTPVENPILKAEDCTADLLPSDFNSNLPGGIFPPGNFEVMATYNGTIADEVNLIVNEAPTTTSLATSLNPSTVGQLVTFTATVPSASAGAAVPTGTVTFSFDGNAITAMVTLASNGVAQLALAALAPGTHTVTASYSGDSNYLASVSSTVTQVVNQITSTTSLQAVPPASTFGQSVTLAAAVSPSTATGTVTFLDGSTTLASAPLSAGTASFSTSALSLGSHSLTASYGGDTNDAASVSSPVTEMVNQVSTTTSLKAVPTSPSAGQSVALTATVSPSTATGTVTFLDGSTTLGSAPLSAGTASFSTSTLSGGNHSLTASYGGDTNDAPSVSPPVTEAVGLISTTTSFEAIPLSSNPGQTVVLNATVSPSTATGTVTFLDGSSTLGSTPLSAGTASFSTSTLSGGSHSLTASYGGDSNDAPSVSPPVTVSVARLTTTTALTAAPNPAVAGQSVTLTATVSPGNPTGTVSFFDGANLLGSNPVASGVATFATSTLSTGSHSLTASYSGDTNNAPCTSAAFNESVNGATTVPAYIISTFAGSTAQAGIAGTSATLSRPQAVAVDTEGNVFFAGQNAVLRLDATTHILTRAAGNGMAGFSGDGGPATNAQLNDPEGIAVDSAGDIYIADTANQRIRKVTSGVIATVAGNGWPGFSGDNGLAASAPLNSPCGVAVDSADNLYIADSDNHRIRKVTNGGITTVAGDGTAGFGGDNGPAISAQLNNPLAVAVDSAGNLYIADSGNYRIRQVTNGAIATVAGNGTAGFSGDDGPATSAELSSPDDVSVDQAGNLYIADQLNNRIRKVSNGVIASVAWGETSLGKNSPATKLNGPTGVAVDVAGNLYIADSGNNRIRKLTNGAMTTVAGGGSNLGDSGPATRAQLDSPSGVAVDSAGNVYIADTDDNRIRKVENGVITTVAGGGSSLGENVLATSAQLGSPNGVAVDSAGDIYIADTANDRIRKVTNGVIATVAGNGTTGFSGDSGPATSAELSGPEGIAVDSAGNLYIADTANNRIRKVTGGTITTVAGGGSSFGDGGPATSAQLHSPAGVAVDLAGNFYVADTGANRIRKVTSGVIATVAGGGSSLGDNGPATSAELSQPNGVAVDSAGNLYIADTANQRIRMVVNSVIFTVGGNGTFGFSGDNGPGTSAQLDFPFGVAVEAGGDTYIADTDNNRVRLLQPLATSFLTVTSTHSGNFTQGQQGASYTVMVSNGASGVATNGLVTVTDTTPSGLTLISMSGTGWNCSSNTCTRSDALNPGASYPALSVTVNVAGSAGSPVTNQVLVWGGGSDSAAASDVTTIGASSSPCSISLSPGSASLQATGTSTVEVCPNNSGQPNCGVIPETAVSFTVTPGAACGAWTATSSNAEFLQITSGASGSGAGTVAFVLLNNTHNGQQSYSITVASGTASATYSVTEAGSGDSQVYREVYALYEQLLGRDPDPGGFAFWSGSGGAGLGQMADSFLTSPEAFNSDFAVMAAYQAATGAPPTYAQYTAAVTGIRAATQTVPGLFTSLIGGGFTATTLYENLLNRAPGSGDTACINSGLSTCFQTIIGFPASTTPVGATNNEFQSTGTYQTTIAADHTNALYVQMIYYVSVSRNPDAAGLAFWVGIANSGGPGLLFQGSPGYGARIQILGPGTPNQGFIGSPEFQGLFAN